MEKAATCTAQPPAAAVGAGTVFGGLATVGAAGVGSRGAFPAGLAAADDGAGRGSGTAGACVRASASDGGNSTDPTGSSGTGVSVVAVEPTGCRALNAAIEHGGPVDVPVDSVAADSLGARRASRMAYDLAVTSPTRSVLVPDEAILGARQRLWDDYRLVVEPGGATAFAALLAGAYVPRPGERVAVVLCGANTDPSDLVIR